MPSGSRFGASIAASWAGFRAASAAAPTAVMPRVPRNCRRVCIAGEFAMRDRSGEGPGGRRANLPAISYLGPMATPALDASKLETERAARPSALAGSLIGSEILKIAADVRAMAADGRDICNLTVGDFSPAEFRIPELLERGIVEALRRGETNYPPSDGILPLREAVRSLY